MPVFADADQINLRRLRTQFQQPDIHPNPRTARPSKPSIFSLFLSPFSANTNDSPSSKKKANAFRGLGCTSGAAQQVSAPAVIRSSSELEGNRVKKKKNPLQQKRNKDSIRICSENLGEGSNSSGNSDNNGSSNPGSCTVVQDVWCGHGLTADAVVGSVDCVVSRRNASGGGKIDGDKINSRERERERASCLGRWASMDPSETLSFLDSEPAFLSSRPEPEFSGSRYYRHVRHPCPDRLAEFMMLHSSIMMGERMDRFSDWRLDIDHMSYEQLLELGERIGCVSTGLKEDEIGLCVTKLNLSIMNDLSSHLQIVLDKKCSICQEDYEGDDDLGKLECGHGFHIECIEQWLKRKNACPVCKKEPVARV